MQTPSDRDIEDKKRVGGKWLCAEEGGDCTIVGVKGGDRGGSIIEINIFSGDLRVTQEGRGGCEEQRLQ